MVTEAAIREALRLDDAKGVDCLPNEDIFYRCMSAKRTSWNEFSSSMASAVICLSTGDLLTHTTKYTSPALTQKVFANIRRVGKGFFGVETPLFEGMLVEQEIDEEGDADEHVEEVNTGDAAHGDYSAAHGEVPTITEEPSIPSSTPPTPPLQPSQDIPSTSQVQQTPPQSPQVQPPSLQPQPQQQAADFPMSLLQEVMDACAALTRRVENLEYDKVAQALEITMLKKRRVDTSDDTVMDDESNQGRMIAEMDQDDVVVLKDDKEEDKEVADKDVEEAKEDKTKPAKAQVPAATLTVAPARVVAAPTIDHVKRKAKEDHSVKRYQVLKRKPQTEAQARKNMIMYLKNVAGFKMDYFKGMYNDDIRLIFEAKFNSNVAFLLKTKEHIEEDENRALQKLNETPAERAAKRRKLDEEIWKTRRNEHGPAKVKGWKLLESCGVQIITFTSTQLILLVERKYPLTRFTLDRMLNAVRLEVEEESEVSLELLRFIRQQHQEGQLE
nr:hypothetical protein [Tanacetum cinerariifolium]